MALSIERLSDVVVELRFRERAGSAASPCSGRRVTFQSVDFRFAESTPLVVKNVSFQVPAGAFIGIVGGSGSGKSAFDSSPVSMN